MTRPLLLVRGVVHDTYWCVSAGDAIRAEPVTWDDVVAEAHVPCERCVLGAWPTLTSS